ncbi:MAG: DUF4160 domain-containing protein [Sphingobacteriaceae bacterium]|nr:DUF4160 domain-containing protein [Cytophagaceae bacterium]
MPTVALFDGIKIEVFPNDHNPPHFHVTYSGEKAIIDIQRLAIIQGSLPAKQFRKVVEWAETRQEILLIRFREQNQHLR